MKPTAQVSSSTRFSMLAPDMLYLRG